ncbi:MAG: hypothetical protein RL148_1358 [Planctomycetota bacterium]
MTQLAATRSDARPRTLVQSWLRARVLRRLEGLRSGALVVREGDAETMVGNAQGPLGPVTIEVMDGAFWKAVAFGGSLGAGESWVEGHWTCVEPARLVRLFVRDREVLDGVESGLARLTQPLARLVHWCNRNHRSGSRRNIAAHYDLGNDFFSLILDPTMTYSSALFASEQVSLEQAQQAKLERLCNKIALGPADRLVEIGTGWGSMALCAAGRFGAHVTTTTISRRQAQVARERIATAGLGDRITLLEQDYRDLQGTFDKLVSVEMVEAVGHQFLPGYLAKCSSLLRPGGAMVLQAITLADQYYAAALRSVDYIQKHIFPGSFIPSVTALVDAATKATDLRLFHLENIGDHYAETLRRWRIALRERWDDALELGYPASLLRAYEWYFAYCEGGFAERHLGVCQMVFVKPGSRLAVADLPALR